MDRFQEIFLHDAHELFGFLSEYSTLYDYLSPDSSGFYIGYKYPAVQFRFKLWTKES